ncbi:DNA repair protein RecO [Roseateles sp. BYS180W]|uniref:DNA repair protein RecO n=1 Tax=Roseateles rivi TaxID=3299028 RepID=A0ABW7FSB2_9BURK
MAARAAAPQQHAYVLHHYDWSETSLVLELFTREHGRIAVVAKGAKRPYSQLRGVLLPFMRLNVGLSKPSKLQEQGVAEVQTLRSAEWLGGATLPAGAALFSGYYLNELLMKFLPRHDPHPQLFDAYALALPQLSQPEEQQAAQAALRAFELRLLADCGLLPELSVLATTQQDLQAETLYTLSADSGVQLPAYEAPQLRGRHWVALQAALLHGSVAALQQACEQCCTDHGAALKAVLRALLQYHLGQRPLRTREVLVEAQKLLN